MVRTHRRDMVNDLLAWGESLRAWGSIRAARPNSNSNSHHATAAVRHRAPPSMTASHPTSLPPTCAAPAHRHLSQPSPIPLLTGTRTALAASSHPHPHPSLPPYHPLSHPDRTLTTSRTSSDTTFHTSKRFPSPSSPPPLLLCPPSLNECPLHRRHPSPAHHRTAPSCPPIPPGSHYSHDAHGHPPAPLHYQTPPPPPHPPPTAEQAHRRALE